MLRFNLDPILHKPEPWPDAIKGGGNSHLTEIDYRRAQLCVNACAGIADNELEAFAAHIKLNNKGASK